MRIERTPGPRFVQGELTAPSPVSRWVPSQQLRDGAQWCAPRPPSHRAWNARYCWWGGACEAAPAARASSMTLSQTHRQVLSRNWNAPEALESGLSASQSWLPRAAPHAVAGARSHMLQPSPRDRAAQAPTHFRRPVCCRCVAADGPLLALVSSRSPYRAAGVRARPLRRADGPPVLCLRRLRPGPSCVPSSREMGSHLPYSLVSSFCRRYCRCGAHTACCCCCRGRSPIMRSTRSATSPVPSLDRGRCCGRVAS